MRKPFTVEEILKITELDRIKTVAEENQHRMNIELKDSLETTYNQICQRTLYLPFVSDYIAKETVYFQIVFARFLVKCIDLMVKHSNPIWTFCNVVYRIGKKTSDINIDGESFDFTHGLKVGLLKFAMLVPICSDEEYRNSSVNIEAARFMKEVLVGDNLTVFCNEDVDFIIKTVDEAIETFIIKLPEGEIENEK